MPVKKTYTSPYEDERAKAERQRRLAEIMQSQAFAPEGETSTYQGFRAMPSAATALSKVLAAYTSKKLGEKADTAEAAARQADLQAFQQLRSELGPQTRSITGEALPSQDFAGIASALQPANMSQQGQVETVMPSPQQRTDRLMQAAVSSGSPTAARYAQLMLSREPTVGVEALMEASPESAAEFKRTGDWTTLRKPTKAQELPNDAQTYEYYAGQEIAAGRTPKSFDNWYTGLKRAGASSVDVRYGAPVVGTDPTTGEDVFWRPPTKGDGAPQIVQGIKPKPETPKESEANSAGFADRAANAATLLETLKSPSMLSRGKKGIPGVGQALVSPEDRRFSQAEDDFITAVLRKESGATFGEGEFERERNKYIPGPFDDEALREQKRRSREAAIQALARGADRRYKMPPVLPPAGSGITMPEWLEMTIDERRKFSK